MDRITARENAMKLVYEWEMGGVGGEETESGLLEVQTDEPERDFMRALAEGTCAHAADLDAQIAGYLRGWTIQRLSRVDLAILRLAVYELTEVGQPAAVVISSAVELAKRYSGEKAGALVNGVLGNLARDRA